MKTQKVRFNSFYSLSILMAVGVASTSLSFVTGAHADNSKEAVKKAVASPPETTTVTLNKKKISVDYSAPSKKDRVIFDGLVPYGKVWRTGANNATTLKTESSLTIGTTPVPAGTYTLYTLPTADSWKLIINKQTGQWGTVYKQDQDLARVDMTKAEIKTPQEKMTISFENTVGDKTELHIRWDNTDVSVPISASAPVAK